MPHVNKPNSGVSRTRRSRAAISALFAATLLPSLAQQPERPQPPLIRTTTDEVVLDLVVRDKKGKPVTDLKPGDLTVLDNDVKQTLTGFRLVSGSEAIGANGAKTPLDP